MGLVCRYTIVGLSVFPSNSVILFTIYLISRYSDGRARSDSAYGESMRSSSVASTSLTSNAPSTSKGRNENGKSSGRGSHSSSLASLDEESSSGYARIEDIQIMKENVQNRYALKFTFLWTNKWNALYLEVSYESIQISYHASFINVFDGFEILRRFWIVVRDTDCRTALGQCCCMIDTRHARWHRLFRGSGDLHLWLDRGSSRFEAQSVWPS